MVSQNIWREIHLEIEQESLFDAFSYTDALALHTYSHLMKCSINGVFIHNYYDFKNSIVLNSKFLLIFNYLKWLDTFSLHNTYSIPSGNPY